MVGVAALLLQPFSGLLYASIIRSSVPEAYEQLVRGPYQWLVVLQFFWIGVLFVGSHLVLRTAWSSGSRATGIDVLFMIAGIALVASVGHTALRRAWLYLLVFLILWSLTRLWRHGRSFDLSQATQMRPVMVGLGVVALLTYLTMGTIRETARRPDTVWKVISLHDEARQPVTLHDGRGLGREKLDLRSESID